MIAVCVGLLPFAAKVLPENPTVLPFLLAIALAADLVTAFLLFSQFVASRMTSACVLGGAYLAGGLGVLSYILTFPGVLGGIAPLQTAPHCWILWHVVWPAGVITALWFERRKSLARDKEVVARWITVTVACSVAAVVPLAVAFWVFGPYLPPVLADNAYNALWSTACGELIVALNLVALALALAWTQARTVLQTWLIVALVASALDVQMSVAGQARFSLGWYIARVLVLLGSSAVLVAYLDQMHVLFGKLSDLSMIDGLTGVGNRRMFEMRVLDLIRDAHRNDRPLALCFIDVDHFKKYNDTYGHFAGDEALRAVASTLRSTAKRPHDVVARYGGEEFVVVLPETPLEGAHQVAERLRQFVADLAIPHRNTTVPGERVTISVGVGILGDRSDDAEKLIERADAALYRAKENGRNRVAVEGAPSERSLSIVREELFEGMTS